MQTVEQRPCPFCGAAAAVDVTHPEYAKWCPRYDISCVNCGASLFGHETEADAIAAWNTRLEASLPPSAPVDEPKPWTMDAARELHAGMIQAARDCAGSHGAPQSEVREAGSMFLYRALLALPPSGIAEMVRKAIAEERASVVAYLRMLSDAARAHHREVCEREEDEILDAIVTRMESHAFSAEQIEKGTHDPASAIRSLDLSNKGVG